MLLGLPARDVRVIARGLAALILAVAVGVTAVEHQLNQLTGSGAESMQKTNLLRNDCESFSRFTRSCGFDCCI